MGISKGGARLLLAEAATHPFYGRVMQLGRQHLFFNEHDLSSWASLHDTALHPEFVANNRRTPLLNAAHIDDGSFFALLGFQKVESCDISNNEQPTHIVDLNRPITENLVGQYDLVFDGGTIEHIFHIPQALANIHAMLKPGGRIIHISPSSNHVDHGFYMFSPTLFTDYYAANRYKICNTIVFEYTKNHNNDPWNIYRYEPGCLDAMSFGGFDQGTLLGIFVVAQKQIDSDCQIIPQQGAYLRQWNDAELAIVRERQYAGQSLNGSARAETTPLRPPASARPIDALKIAEY